LWHESGQSQRNIALSLAQSIMCAFSRTTHVNIFNALIEDDTRSELVQSKVSTESVRFRQTGGDIVRKLLAAAWSMEATSTCSIPCPSHMIPRTPRTKRINWLWDKAT
jgi:hypothetical protein